MRSKEASRSDGAAGLSGTLAQIMVTATLGSDVAVDPSARVCVYFSETSSALPSATAQGTTPAVPAAAAVEPDDAVPA